VAREANVSLSTVSKVLNGHTDAKFTAATRDRVAAAARRVGYHPSAVARGLAGKRMDALGVIMAYHQTSVTSDPYLGACLDGILRVNKERRQKTILFTENSWADALRHVPSYLDGHCDGLLLIIPRTDAEIVDELAKRGAFFVLVGDSREDERLITADVDNVTASRRLVDYLIGLGHTRIAAFCGNADFLSNSQRLEGYREALTGAGLPLREDYLFPGEYQPQFGAENARLLLNRFRDRIDERPTAIFCFNDAMARGTADALLEQGIAIPDDLSIVGFDDSAHAVSRDPYLTTMRQDIRQVGQRAAEMLLDCISGQSAPGTRVHVPAELIVRSTTAPPSRKVKN
jgi:LacI family transcriptional regulator